MCLTVVLGLDERLVSKEKVRNKKRSVWAGILSDIRELVFSLSVRVSGKGASSLLILDSSILLLGRLFEIHQSLNSGWREAPGSGSWYKGQMVSVPGQHSSLRGKGSLNNSRVRAHPFRWAPAGGPRLT